MKVRIGISAGGESLGPDAMVALGQAVAENGFDSLWLPEVLHGPGLTPWSGWPGLGRLPGPQDRDHHAAPGAQPGLAGQGGRPPSTSSRAAASCSPSCPGSDRAVSARAIGIPPPSGAR